METLPSPSPLLQQAFILISFKLMPAQKTLLQVVNSLPFWLDNWGMSTHTQVEEVLDLSKFFDHLWVTIVWDDPVNLMNYVTYVFIKLFGFSKEKAHELMMQVHNEGKAVVASGTREEMERAVQSLHEHGLWATLQREDHGRI